MLSTTSLLRRVCCRKHIAATVLRNAPTARAYNGVRSRMNPTDPASSSRAASSSVRPTTPSTTATDRIEADLDLMKAGRVHRHPRRRVGVVDVGAARRRVRPRLAAAGARRRARARHPRSSSARRPTPCRRGCRSAHPEIAAERAHGRARSRGARARRSTSRTRSSVPRRARHPRGHRALRRPPRRDRLPGRQRARACELFHNDGVFAAASSRRLQRAVRRRRDAQPRVGADLLVAPARATGRSCGARRQHAARSTTSRGGGTRPTLTTEFIAWQAGIVARVPPRRASS